jgi:hypothetical protein
MDANSGEPWSEMDVADLANSLAYGDTFAQVASFLCRDEDEVRQKAKELGLIEKPPKQKALPKLGLPADRGGFRPPPSRPRLPLLPARFELGFRDLDRRRMI